MFRNIITGSSPAWLIFTGLVFELMFLISFIGYFLLFPFYLYVYKKNRKRDENNALFRTINHFFKMVQVVYLFSAFSLIILIIGYSIGLKMDSKSFLNSCLIIIVLSIWWSLSIMIQVFYILIIILAIEKFALYFFPSSEIFVISVQNYRIKHVKFIYIAIFICQLVLTMDTYGVGMHIINGPQVRSIVFICFNTTFVLSALLYIPIMISVRKFSNLPSVQQNKPQKYIFWQTFNIFIFKLTFIAAVTICLLTPQVFGEMVVFMMFGDIVIIPQIIQISYLGCNKRNMDTLLKSFSCVKFTKIVLNIKETTSIAPRTGLETHF